MKKLKTKKKTLNAYYDIDLSTNFLAHVYIESSLDGENWVRNTEDQVILVAPSNRPYYSKFLRLTVDIKETDDKEKIK